MTKAKFYFMCLITFISCFIIFSVMAILSIVIIIPESLLLWTEIPVFIIMLCAFGYCNNHLDSQFSNENL